MRKIITKHNILVCILLIAILVPLASHAQGMPSVGQKAINVIQDAVGIGGINLNWISLKPISWVIFVINYFIGFIGSTLFILAGGLVELGLKLNATILDSPVVQLGWRIVRDFANLGFTIGIVVIAYATILGYESYGIKKTLWWLIVAAFMVNFSFSIAGFFIDGSNLLTNFFVSKSIGGTPANALTLSADSRAHQLALNLAHAFAPQKLFDVGDPNGNTDVNKFDALIEASGGMLKLIAAMFFITLFTLFASLGMLAVALTMLYRYIWLSVLVIAVPAAIICNVFAHTKKYWDRWYEKFFCHLTYLPAITFSIYLMLMYVEAKGGVMRSGIFGKDAASAATAFNSTIDIMTQSFQTISDMVIMLMLLLVAITASQKMACAAGGFAMNAAVDFKKWVTGQGGTGGPVRTASEWATRKALNAGPEPDKSMGNRLGNVLAKIPVVNRLVSPLRTFMAGANKNVENNFNKYKDFTKGQLLSLARSPLLTAQLSSEELAGMGKALADKGLINADPTKGVSVAEFKKFIPAMKQFGLEKEALKVAPHLFQEFGWNMNTFDAFMAKDFKPENMERVSEEAMADALFVSRLSAAHLKKLDAPDKAGHRAAFSQTLMRMAANPTGLKTFMQKSFAADAMDIIASDVLKNKTIVANLGNAHIAKLEPADKAAHRDALINTLKNEMSGDEARQFMRENFKKAKDVDAIHPDFFKEQRFITNLNPDHVQRLRDNKDLAQQAAFVESLKKSYTEFAPEEDALKPAYFNVLNPLAKPLVAIDPKTKEEAGLSWGAIFYDPTTRAYYDEIKKEYEKWNQPPPQPPAAPPANPPPTPAPTPPSPPAQPPVQPPAQPAPPATAPHLDRLARAIWDINAARQNIEQVAADQENPSVANSAQQILKQAEKKYEKMTGGKPPSGAIPYPPNAVPPEPPIVPGKPNPLISNPPPLKTPPPPTPPQNP